MRTDLYSRRYDSEGRQGWMHLARGVTNVNLTTILTELYGVVPRPIQIADQGCDINGPYYKFCDKSKIIRPREIEFSFVIGYFMNLHVTEFVMASPLHSDRRIIEDILDKVPDFKEKGEHKKGTSHFLHKTQQ